MFSDLANQNKASSFVKSLSHYFTFGLATLFLSCLLVGVDLIDSLICFLIAAIGAILILGIVFPIEESMLSKLYELDNPWHIT